MHVNIQWLGPSRELQKEFRGQVTNRGPRRSDVCAFCSVQKAPQEEEGVAIFLAKREERASCGERMRGGALVEKELRIRCAIRARW